MMQRIAVVTFFFGQLPWYFRFFQQSCGANPTVDFLFFTDNPPTADTPPNLQYHWFTLSDFNQLATKKLGFDINIQAGYKVCDLRPAFGHIFEDHIKGYDWWGYTDIDIIFGQIRAFMTEELLQEYDVVSVKDDYPTGYFTLLKNRAAVNGLYTLSKDYKMVFTAPNNMLFEECGGYYTEVCNGISILDTDCPFDTFFHVLEREKARIRTFFDRLVIERTPGQLKWDKGLLSYRNEFEVLLYHLSDYKLNVLARKKYWTTLPGTYYIDQYNFRKQSVLGWAVKVWTERLYPAWKKCSLGIDRWLAVKLGRRKRDLRTGEYWYMTGKLEVRTDAKGNNLIYYAEHKDPIALYALLFNRHYFYIPFVHRTYRDDGRNFSQVFADGNLIVYTYTKEI
jgi:hypothetical protein